MIAVNPAQDFVEYAINLYFTLDKPLRCRCFPNRLTRGQVCESMVGLRIDGSYHVGQH